MQIVIAASHLAEETPKARLALLLRSFAKLPDDREPQRIMYPLSEVLFLAVCASICSCDDFDDIALWGEHHRDFLRQFSEFHFGIPSARWLRALFNRVDPRLFASCLAGWIAALWPGRHDLIAIDGKTARGSHARSKGFKALHTLSAYATNVRLTLAALAVPEKANEITAIPELLDHLAETKQLQGALVTIDAVGCQTAIAARILAHKADFLLALKGNQPTLEADVASYFATAPRDELTTKTTVEKGHGRIETRIYAASGDTGWILSERGYPGEPRFQGVASILKVVSRVEYPDHCTCDTRLFISSLEPDIGRLAHGARGHWGVESMHWLLDVAFNEDKSRYRNGHGAQNMAAIRRFCLDILRAHPAKNSIKSKRKAAGWSTQFLLEVLQLK